MVSRVVTLTLKVTSANLHCRHCPLRLADFAVSFHCTELSTRPKAFREHKHKLFQVVTSVTYYVECQFLHRPTGILFSDVSFISSKGQERGSVANYVAMSPVRADVFRFTVIYL